MWIRVCSVVLALTIVLVDAQDVAETDAQKDPDINRIVTGECPQGFYKFEEYPGRCYLFSEDAYLWWEARAFCRDHGADLLFIQDAREQLLVAKYIMKYTDLSSKNVRHWWIGAHSLGGGRWRWSAAQHKMSFTQWVPGRPGNSYQRHCALLHTGKQYSWYDTACNYFRDKDGYGTKPSLNAAICKLLIN